MFMDFKATHGCYDSNSNFLRSTLNNKTSLSIKYWASCLLVLVFTHNTAVAGLTISKWLPFLGEPAEESAPIIGGPFETVPEELVVKILKEMSPETLALLKQVSRGFKRISSEVLRDISFEKRHQNTRNLYSSLSIGKFRLCVAELDEVIHKLNYIGSLSKSEIQEILNRRTTLVAFLLDKIRAKNLVNLRDLIFEKGNFNPNKAYLAAFLAKYAVNFGIAQATAEQAAWLGAKEAAWDISDDAIDEAAEGAALGAVVRAAWYAARNAAWGTVQSVIQGAVQDTSRNAAFVFDWDTIRTILNQLELSDLNEIGVNAYHLSELMVLHWLEQNSTWIFFNAFNAAYEKLDESVTIDAAKEIIFGQQNLGTHELSTNVFVEEVKAFLEQAERFLLLNKICREQSDERFHHCSKFVDHSD